MVNYVNDKDEMTMNIIKRLQNQHSIIVYGAGKMAQLIYPCLKECNILVDCFVVSDGQNHKSKLNDIPVYNISDINNENRDTLILICASIIFWDEIKNTLNEKGYNNYILLTPELRRQLFAVYYEKYFNEKKVDYSTEIINFSNFSILNPFSSSNNKNELAPMFSEFGDLILPSIFNDYSLVMEGPYEYGQVVLENTQEGVVFDCGANMGLFSCYAATKGYTSYCFEPTKSLGKILKKHSNLNNNLIIPCNYAISDKPGKVSFGISNYSSGENSFVMQNGATEFVEVNAISVDEFVKINKLNRVDFIKADIEGAERQLIRGAVETLKKFSPMLAICTYHLPDDPQVIEDLILKANPNYKIVHKWMKLYAYIEK
ncbi:FkbM family methyltransferase [Vallitalea sp.]|jgi:FkbM family methyltransferase|uniref:FkbM family methyltransferase n=1 Tax=Vallitalea sp. TaxID=1882829 RepID=UPI0025F84E7F|nr:FkbM family methyltransferase [Vallitalea sp.]MCT4686248.1 FkbM family methyltransferase [Vallitalea sp.]